MAYTLIAALVALAGVLTRPAAAEVAFREGFDGPRTAPPFAHTYGDEPERVEMNAVLPTAGFGGGPGAHLRLAFGSALKHGLAYYTYSLREPVAVVPPLTRISLRVKTNVPVHLKIPIAPYGYIYHGPMVPPAPRWQRIVLNRAYDELKAWCSRGARTAEGALVTGVIVALVPQKGGVADVAVDDVTFEGRSGLSGALQEARRRRTRKVRVAVVSQLWSDEGRTLDAVLEKVDEAARDGADIVSLPMECVKTDGEPIPGPISRALAERAARHRMYVIGNIRQREGGKTFVTSFLCDRTGRIAGRYRKSHKMPDEDMDLGDELPVFQTDFGTIAMRIGSDRFFPDIDHVYTAQGAGIIFWAQQPEPVEDEFSQDFPSEGRAADYHVNIACSRYATAKPGWITNMYPPYCGMPIGRAYVVSREGERIASTPRVGGGVAIAAIPLSQLGADGRGPNRKRAFAALTAPVQVPERKPWARRKVRVTAIEAHLGVEDLLKALDEAGRLGSDIACTYELVWISGPDKGQIARQTEVARTNLARVAAKAKQYGMYVIIAGVVDRIERNEAILFGRDGQEVGRYFKIAKTHDEMICGDDTPVFETDFGRVAVRICADEWMVELDRCYGLKGADILFTPTQSWGPDALFRDRRDISRAMDAGLFLVEVTHPSSELRHRSMIVEPTGAVVARSEYQKASIVSAVIDLDDDRPRRYIREYKPFQPGGYLPEYQPDRMPSAANDLRETILRQRRPELYRVLSPESAPAEKADAECINPTFRDWGAPRGLWDILRYG